MSKIVTHPFRAGVEALIAKHFDDRLAKRFSLEFEANTFSRDLPNVYRQMKDNNYVIEVRFKQPDDTFIYICDLYSWESKARTEHHLLRYVTDKVKTGKIGADWNYAGGRFSEDVASGKHETKEVAT